MMKNAFCFTLKDLFVQKIFEFLPRLFGHAEKCIDYKDKANFKIYNVITWLTNNCNAHILPNISRSKCNQRMKFGQLMEYNMRKIFLERLCTKYGRETIPRPFSKRSKLSIFLDH